MEKQLLGIWYFQSAPIGRDTSLMCNERVQFRQR